MLYTSKHWEVSKTFNLTQQFWLASSLFVSKVYWDTLPADRAIMVWYGIPNPGAARVADNLKWVDMPVSLGININSTNHGQCAPALGRDEILADYLRSAKVLAPFGDYMVLTLSRPNTSEPDLFAKTGNLSLSFTSKTGRAKNASPFL